ANAYARRVVSTVRADCLDRILFAGRRDLERVLRVYVRHYNEHRPHRALGLASRPLDTDPATTLPLSSSSVFAAMMKSLRCRPLILCVHQVTVVLPHSVSSAG